MLVSYHVFARTYGESMSKTPVRTATEFCTNVHTCTLVSYVEVVCQSYVVDGKCVPVVIRLREGRGARNGKKNQSKKRTSLDGEWSQGSTAVALPRPEAALYVMREALSDLHYGTLLT